MTKSNLGDIVDFSKDMAALVTKKLKKKQGKAWLVIHLDMTHMILLFLNRSEVSYANVSERVLIATMSLRACLLKTNF